jgi:hypothetical protein
VVFGDGSREACCFLVYLRWKRGDGPVECRLVTGKTQVTPKVNITVPGMELLWATKKVILSKRKFAGNKMLLLFSNKR